MISETKIPNTRLQKYDLLPCSNILLMLSRWILSSNLPSINWICYNSVIINWILEFFFLKAASCLFCLFEWAQEVTNIYSGNPQWWVGPWFGIQPLAQEQFYWSSSWPWCCWAMAHIGREMICLTQCNTNPNNTYITGQYGYILGWVYDWGTATILKT